MPLDVMAALPATGSGPPGPAGPPDAGPPPGDPMAQFASLLAQQSRPATPLRTTKDAPETALRDTKTKQDDDADTQATPGAPDTIAPDPAAFDWAALAAIQFPQPLLTPAAPPTADAAVRTLKTTQNEVMDTVSPSAPTAAPAPGNSVNGGSLPLPPVPPAPPAEPVLQYAPVAALASVALSGAVPSLTVGTTPASAVPSRAVSLGESAAPSAMVPLPPQPANGRGVSLTPPVTPHIMGADSKSAPMPSAPLDASGTATPMPLFPSVSPLSGVKTVLTPQQPQPDLMPTDLTLPIPAQPDPVQPAPTLPAPTLSGLTSAGPVPAAPVPTAAAPASESVARMNPSGPTLAMPPVPPLMDAVAQVAFSPATAPPEPKATAAPLSPPETASAARPAISQIARSEGPASAVTAPAQIALQNTLAPANNTVRTPPTQSAPIQVAPAQAEALTAAPTLPPVLQGTARVAATVAQVLGSDESKVSGAAPKAEGPERATDDAPEDGAAAGPHRDDEVAPMPLPLPSNTPSVSAQGQMAATRDKPLTGAERAQVMRQTADGIGMMKPQVAATGQGRMTLQLHPKEWGDLRVTVQMTPTPPVDGVKQISVMAHVVAGSPAVKAALENQASDLNHALRETGLRLERLTVTVQAPGADAQSGSAPGGGRSFGSDRQDQWQAAQPQANAGNGGFGAGGSSASFSERQGGGTHPNPAAPRSGGRVAEEVGLDAPSVSGRTSRYAGFDQRV